MSRRKVVAVLCNILMISALGISALTPHEARATDDIWEIVNVSFDDPNPVRALYGVSAIASNDVWAAGGVAT